MQAREQTKTAQKDPKSLSQIPVWERPGIKARDQTLNQKHYHLALCCHINHN